MTLLFQDNPSNILGANSADNQFDSSSVAADADGSMIERQEYMQGLIAALTAGDVLLQGAVDAAASSTTEIPIAGLAGYGNDFFNNQWYLQVLCNKNSAGNAPEKQVRNITDYVSATGTFTCDAFSAVVEATDLCLILHESQVAIGRNDADNVYDSSTAVANADGSIIEMIKDVKAAITTVDDFVDTEIAALQADVTLIKGYVGGTDSAATILGANNNNNAVNTDQVAANENGSVLERLEDLKDKVDAVDNYVDSEVAAIKAETDLIGTIVNAGGTATLGALLGDFANVTAVSRLTSINADIGDASARTNLQSIMAMLGNPDTAAQSIWDCLAGAGGIASWNAAAAPGANVSMSEVLRDAWDVLRNGTGGSEPSTNLSILDVLAGSALSKNATNYLSAAITMVDSTTGAVTTHEVFTVTGMVRMRMWIECTSTLTDAANAATIQLGLAGATTAFIAATDTDDIETGEFWVDATPTETYGNYSSIVFDKVINGGVDVGYEVAGEAITGGALTFHCVWEPMNATGAVVAADGTGTL